MCNCLNFITFTSYLNKELRGYQHFFVDQPFQKNINSGNMFIITIITTIIMIITIITTIIIIIIILHMERKIIQAFLRV